jgi:antitoxin component of MazEF toxin-antitoxin module
MYQPAYIHVSKGRDMAKLTLTRQIKRHGNGAMVSIHRRDMEEIAADIGSTIRLTVEKVDDNYDATRKAASRMRYRFARTLDLLGQ